MTSMIGTTISHFKVTSKVGEGGMGEVYRATDLRLNREVAVKALPEAFVQDTQRLARFEREAQLLASLSHPNIAGIHGLEEQDGKRFLILELVEGEDLAERLRRGAIPLEEALAIALQIAEALEAAHDKGIVHRDLKPANVKLTPQGQVKVLDFGLAKALEVETTSDEELANSPTLTMAATQAGIILGTAAYMAPEQAAAQPADRRADVWSFGVVLTEMLTGEQLFTGQTASHVLAAVLQKDVDVGDALPDVPPPIRDLVERCLRKDVRQRLQAIGDARIAIEEYLADPEAHEETVEPAAAAAEPVSSPLWQRLLPWAVAAVLLAAVVVLALRREAEPLDAGRQLVQASITPPEGLTFDLDPSSPGPAAVSPDGSMIALTARSAAGDIELYVRRLDEHRARLLQDTEGAAYPFWSPDNRSLGFFTDEGNLKRIEIAGGPPTVIAEAANGKGASWGADGTILFAPAHNTPIQRVAAGGGEVSAVTELVEGDVSHRHPRLLPDGTSFLYLERTRVDGSTTESQLVLASLDGGEEKILLRTPAAAEFASGHILFLHEETLMTRPFDVASGEFSGDAKPLASDVTLISVGSAKGLFSASENGVLVYGTGQNRPGTQVMWFGRNGGVESSLDEVTRYLDVTLSPDDEFAALGIIDPVLGSEDLWIYEIGRNLRTRFTFDQGNDSGGVWSPDGTRLAFASDRGQDWAAYVKSLSGVGEEELVVAIEGTSMFPESWSPDGSVLALTGFHESTQLDIWLVPMEGEGEAAPFLQTSFSEASPTFSPDGRWLAYSSDDSGRFEVFVTPYPGPGRKWQVSRHGGNFPVWRADGGELYFQDPGGRVMAAEVGARGDTFLVGEVESLFQGPPITRTRGYDPTNGGQKFIVLMPEERQGTRPLNLVVGWTELLRR